MFAGSAFGAVARWTPAAATKKVGGKCVGVGKPVAGRYASFKCAKGGVLWVKVRLDGKSLCWSRTSLAAVPKACMTMPTPGQG